MAAWERLSSPRNQFRGMRSPCPAKGTLSQHGYTEEPLFFLSDKAHPDREGGDKQADGNEGQNIVDEIGHGNNSSLFTYVYYLFHFCSNVNTCSACPFILGFTNDEQAKAARERIPKSGNRFLGCAFKQIFAIDRSDPVRSNVRALNGALWRLCCTGNSRGTVLSVSRLTLRQ